MGLDITYKAGESELSFRLPPSDIDILEFLRIKGFEREVEMIFGVSEFGELTEVNRKILLESVSGLVDSIRKDSDSLPYVYSTKTEISRGSGLFSGGGGVISGFKIGGIPHSIEAGIDKCVLKTRKQDKSGKWSESDAKDVRGEKVIKTDEDNFFGDIEIKKKRKPTKLIQNLEKLRSFLTKSCEKTVYKILS